MQKKKPDIDVINKVLDICYKANPDALFIMSLMHQYEERGSLSKKQLQGLYQKASKVTDMPVSLLATLEALILKMPNRFKSEIPEHVELFTKNEEAHNLITEILSKYPEHKRVLFLKSKNENNELITPAEITELQKFKKLLFKS